MLLSRGDPISVRILLDCIEDFGNKSGLRMNVLKSNIFIAGINVRDTGQILSLSHLSRGSMPFRYLGIPLAAERLKVAHFEELTKKIRTYIDGWSALTLSYASRAELIRSVLQGIECYWLSIFPLPDAVCTKIVKLIKESLLQHFGSWNRVESKLTAWRDNHKIKGRNQTYEFFRHAEIRAWIGIKREMSTLSSGLKWLKKEAKGTSRQSKVKCIAFATTVYHIWNARNRLIFEDEVPNPNYVIHRIKTHVYKVVFSLYPSVLIDLENLAIGDS
ncbi:hypothetical protein DH2020_016982 [Rehmannia glutinosa]|uniref:Reverse transcriptase n=1 Tax=Rehmannia glutinosa TaxID=99300 RepID=A0ABR0WSX4_REHGL